MGLRDKRWSNIVFAGLFGISLLLLFRILLPFLVPVLLGGFLVILFQPVHRVLERLLGDRPSVTAGLATVAVILLLVGPLCLIAWLVGREMMSFAIQSQLLLADLDLRHELDKVVPQSMRKYVRQGAEAEHLEQALIGAMFGGASLIKKLLEFSTELAVDLFLMTVATYYLFLDGRRLLRDTLPLLPLEPRYVHAFTKEFSDVAHAIVYGNTLTALIQGLLGGLGLFIAGVPHAPVWAAAMALVALVPIGGTALVWGPIGLVWIVMGKVPEGLFVWTWGVFIVSSIDNVLRPKLCGARMALHPLLVFLSMFGGLAVFGLAGLLLGPLIASFFMAMLRIYRRDFHRPGVATAPARDSSVGVQRGAESEVGRSRGRSTEADAPFTEPSDDPRIPSTVGA